MAPKTISKKLKSNYRITVKLKSLNFQKNVKTFVNDS